jgi:hypothetical protein
MFEVDNARVESKRMRVAILLALYLLWPDTAFTQRAAGDPQPPLVYIHSNGGPGFSSREQITVRQNGTVTFETSGPIAFDWSTQNRVGEFETKVDATTYTALVDAFRRALPKGPHQDRILPDAGVESIALGKEPFLRRMAGDPSPIFDALAARFAPLAAAARQHPVRALELSCAKSAEGLACRVQSVGTSPVPAPSFTNGRYWCFDRQRHMLPLSAPMVDGAGHDFAPGQGVDLLLTGAACDFHVVIEVSSGVFVSGLVVP